MEELLVPFQYGYMQKAIYVSALIGAVCGFLSCFVIFKRWSLMGDALSHAVVPGVSIAYLVGAPFALGAFISGLLASIGMGFIKAKTQLREDAVIGVVFTSFFALGLLLISLYPSGISLKTIVFGNILGISDTDIVQMLLISVITLLILGSKWREYALFCFDPEYAKSLGINTIFLHYSLLTLLSATAVASLQTVGASLVVATLVTPAASAYLLTDRFGKLIFISILIGFFTGFFGAYLSYFLDGSTGGCVIVLQSLIFLLSLLLAPKHGILATRSKSIDSLSGLAI